MRWKDSLREHLFREYPREACGLLVNIDGQQVYRRCRNTATTEDQFILHPEDWAEAEDLGTIEMVLHTHPMGPADPSMADRTGCEKSGIPWGIMDRHGRFVVLNPEGFRPPLIGRPFVYGVLDCWSLVREYLLEKLSLDLPDQPRLGHWWKRGENRLEEYLLAHGFRPVGKPETHDLILFRVRSDVPNHVAVYVGDGRMLHHPADGLSCEIPFRHEWQRSLYGFMRYQG